MSTAKTQVNLQILNDFLSKRAVSSLSLKSITGGELSQAYTFSENGKEKILRINKNDEGFQKDKYAAEHFSSDQLPIPQIEEIGKLADGMYFAISERATGKPLDMFSSEEVLSMMPAIVDLATTIHKTKLNNEGYGWWRIDGTGKCDTWLEALDEMQEADDDYKLKNVSFFEPDFYKRVTDEIKKYYQYCPEERHLVHQDYGYDNVIADGDRITGVIDWHGSMYGDFLWDVAWLEFWDKSKGYKQAFRDYYAMHSMLPEHFDERIKCYKLITGKNSMAFFAKSNQAEKYKFAKTQLEFILNEE